MLLSVALLAYLVVVACGACTVHWWVVFAVILACIGLV